MQLLLFKKKERKKRCFVSRSRRATLQLLDAVGKLVARVLVLVVVR